MAGRQVRDRQRVETQVADYRQLNGSLEQVDGKAASD